MLSFALCATHSLAHAQSQLAGSDDSQGYWTVSSKWTSGSNSGTVGYGVGFDGETVTESYGWDYKTQDFTGEAPTANAEALITSQIMFGPGSISGDQALYAQAHSTSYGTTAKAQAGGSAEFTFKWVPTVADGKPSKDLHVFISSKAVGNVFVMSGGDGSPITGKVWASADGKPKDDPQEQPVVTSPLKISLGGKLYTVSKDALSSTISVSLEAGADTPGFSEGRRIDAMAYLEASTQVDDRSVSLSRSGAPAAKKADDPSLNQARDEYVDADGTGHGHTLSSYWDRIMLPPIPPGDKGQIQDDPHDVIQNFTAVPVGTWSNNLQFQWSPSETTDTIDHSSQVMPRTAAVNNPEGLTEHLFGPVQTSEKEKGWLNTPAAKGKEFTITYDLTDNNDGITATAKYQLKLHDEWENATLDKSFWLPTAGSPDEEGYSMGPWQCRATRLPNGNALNADPEANWTIGATDTSTVELKFDGSLGFKLGDWISFGGSGSQTTQLSDTIDYKATSQKPKDRFDAQYYSQAGTQFQPIIVFRTRIEHKLVQHWTAQGFDPNPTNIWHSLDYPDYGKWPQSKEVGIAKSYADWLIVGPNQAPFPEGQALPYNPSSSGHTS